MSKSVQNCCSKTTRDYLIRSKASLPIQNCKNILFQGGDIRNYRSIQNAFPNEPTPSDGEILKYFRETLCAASKRCILYQQGSYRSS